MIDCPNDICNLSIFIDGVQHIFENGNDNRFGTITVQHQSKVSNQISTVAVLEGREPKYSVDVRIDSNQQSEVQVMNGVLFIQIF